MKSRTKIADFLLGKIITVYDESGKPVVFNAKVLHAEGNLLKLGVPKGITMGDIAESLRKKDWARIEVINLRRTCRLSTH